MPYAQQQTVEQGGSSSGQFAVHLTKRQIEIIRNRVKDIPQPVIIAGESMSRKKKTIEESKSSFQSN